MKPAIVDSQRSVRRPKSKASKLLWQTMDGEVLTVEEMATTHIFNSLRMIFNHTVPEVLSLKQGNRYAGVRYWPIEVKRAAVRAFLEELSNRKPLPNWMLAQLAQMRRNAKVCERLQITTP